ncbi:CamS family sex pheromone protein [Ornithinibacillus halotolerans]|uniref:Lipoprotein YerH n=1 Tax=Ornithinibacillus halotolerans TaxID=1274357 RepID=A0A916RXU6_9BACI|nr:CamS family sex pheromone protein [Ornithinibacillus halotolerans]GGA75562.1 putative lipoprotein YerH [Ornithinibacillus halotolerans]
MKKLNILLLCILLLLASCAPSFDNGEEELVQEQPTGTPSIVPSYKLSDEDYRVILPYRTSKARGAIINQMKTNRLDIDEMEEGLMRHSKEYFDPNKYYFEEGQYLDYSTVLSWIDELNPNLEDDASIEDYENNPRTFTHILEHNYLKRNEDKSVELVGVSIGIALKSQYIFHAEGRGPFYRDISEAEMLKTGKEVASTVLQRLRQIEGLLDVPIMIALYREEQRGSAVPGNFVAKTYVEASDMSIKDWDTVEEDYILFPSKEAEQKYLDDAEIVGTFGEEISQFFPNYVGYIGEGFYVNEELQKLTIEVPIEFNGKAEILGFAQYTYMLVKDKFPNNYDIEIKISSSNQLEGYIYREAGKDDPIVHIF